MWRLNKCSAGVVIMQGKARQAPESNVWIGYWGLNVEEQVNLLRKLFKNKKLSYDPRGRYEVILISSDIGTRLNPTYIDGRPLFFSNPQDAEDYIKARKLWFEEKDMPVKDAVACKLCPTDSCNCQNSKPQGCIFCNSLRWLKNFMFAKN